MKRIFGVALAVAAVIMLSGTSAYADSNYTPDKPVDPTLAGSTAVAECDGDVPWIRFTVALTDPNDLSTSHTARLILTDGTSTTEIPLGDLEGNELQGRVLWPGASIDETGTPTGWPGWELRDGTWVETSGNFAWTRGAITARIEVNPQVDVPLAYPPATPVCAVGPESAATGAGTALPATGLDVPVLPLAAVGGGLLLVGASVLIARRARRARTS